ncbi:relaxase/mobilization nuclease domain-containing protein [Carboxylicivirga sp. RSCT41]|uniref:relaxase/mobilization nuclease domain-containing protein n=1 Tax=Carboxylicivirga agarovorans TaxID=3417570 RepID=UPI003D345775
MVIKIHQTASTKDAFYYNEEKVAKGYAHFFHSKNTIELRPFAYPSSQRLAQLIAIEKGNKRCQNKCFHVSVNPTNEELVKLSKEGLKKEIDAFMQHMGYGNQPYFVYEHADLKRTHFHIVSSRIDAQTNKKIKDNNEKRKVHQFVRELQQRYELDTRITKLDKVQLIPTINSPNLHEGIQQVFKLLNQSNVQNRQQYLDLLKGFNLELHQSEQGQSVVVKDQDGQILRHPMALSQFNEQPLLDDIQPLESNLKLQQELQQKTEGILKELNKSYRFYTTKELREAFIRNKLLPYKLSKSSNLNIYSPMDKTVVDAQFLMKKYQMRHQTFVLSNDRFYDIIREFSEYLTNKYPNGIEALLDATQSAMDGSQSRKIALKALNLDECIAYNQVAVLLDEKERRLVKMAVKTHLEFITNKVVEKSQNSSMLYNSTQGRSYWDKLNHQFLIELLNYQNWESRKNRNQRKGVKKNWKKGRKKL